MSRWCLAHSRHSINTCWKIQWLLWRKYIILCKFPTSRTLWLPRVHGAPKQEGVGFPQGARPRCARAAGAPGTALLKARACGTLVVSSRFWVNVVFIWYMDMILSLQSQVFCKSTFYSKPYVAGVWRVVCPQMVLGTHTHSCANVPGPSKVIGREWLPLSSPLFQGLVPLSPLVLLLMVESHYTKGPSIPGNSIWPSSLRSWYL